MTDSNPKPIIPELTINILPHWKIMFNYFGRLLAGPGPVFLPAFTFYFVVVVVVVVVVRIDVSQIKAF
jgi:hypothetical protein